MQQSSLDHRRDNRTVEVFQKDIELGTEKERLWGLILRQHYKDDGKACKIVENGVDNSGELITGKLSNYNADKKYVFKDGTEQLVEIKTAPMGPSGPKYPFFSFKVGGLAEYAKQGAYLMVPMLDHFYLFPPKVFPEMLKYEWKIYPGFSPNDEAVRIYMPAIENWISQGLAEKVEWGDGAKKLIEKHKSKLTEERKK